MQLNLDMTINRSALLLKLAKYSNLLMPSAISSGLQTCPEPTNYDILSFMTCLKQTCMASIPIPSFLTPPSTSVSGFTTLTPLQSELIEPVQPAF